MGDVDDGDPTVLQPPDDAKQIVGLVLGQRRSRLVEHHDPRLAAVSLGDLHQLALTGREVLDYQRRVEIDVQLVQWLPGLFAQLGAVQKPSWLTGWRPRRMFSATFSSGTRSNSW